MVTRMVRLVFILLLAGLVIACSRTQLAYENADWLLERYAGRAIDISAVQREQWQPVLARTLRQHRSDELPQILAYLDLADRVISRADESADAACLVDGALVIAEQHSRLAVDLTLPLLADLEPSQISHLADYMKRRERKLERRYLDPDPENREVERQTRFIHRIESWTGSLNAEQRQLVEDALVKIPDLAPDWLAYRTQQTTRLLQLLEASADTRVLEQYLYGWWVEWDGRPDAYTQQWRLAKQEFINFLDRLGPTLTERQREKLHKRLGKLRTDLAAFLPPGYTPLELLAGDSVCSFAPA